MEHEKWNVEYVKIRDERSVTYSTCHTNIWIMLAQRG
jgi:hypothetical protein